MMKMTIVTHGLKFHIVLSRRIELNNVSLYELEIQDYSMQRDNV
jgi:hypothetical protein